MDSPASKATEYSDKKKDSTPNKAPTTSDPTTATSTAEKKAPVKKPPNAFRPKYPKLTDSERVRLAAAFINDAQSARFDNGEASGFFKGPLAHWAFNLYYSHQFQTLVYVVIWIHLGLILVEPSTFRDGDSLYRLRICAFVEVLLTLFHIFDTYLKVIHMGRKEFFSKGWWNCSTMYFRWLIGLDALACAVFGFPYRVTRFMRPALLVTRNRELRQLYDTVSGSVRELMEVASLILVLILFSGMVGVQLFGWKVESESTNWTNYWESMLSLFLLLNGANFPDIMTEASAVKGWYALFFIVFLFMGVHFLLPLVLAVVVDSYKSQQKEVVTKDRVKERKALVESFVLLDADKKGYILYDRFKQVILQRYPNMPDEKIRFVFKALNQDNNDRLDMLEYIELCDILLLKFEKVKDIKPFKLSFLEPLTTPLSYLCAWSYFGLWFMQPLVSFGTFQEWDRYLVYLFAVEVFIRILAFGLRPFLASNWNRIDATCLLASLGITLLKTRPDLALAQYSTVTDILIIVAAWRGLRILALSSTARSRLETIVRVAPFMGYFSSALLLIFYAYSVVGVELLSHKLESGAFDSFGTAMTTLFCAMMNADWSGLMYDSMAKLHPSMVLFYISFWVIIGVIVLNLFLAVIMDAYQVQETSENAVDMEVVGDCGVVSTIRVQKTRVKWKRELLRNDLPELKRKELQQLSKACDVDLLSIYDAKESQPSSRSQSALNALHATLYGAQFVAKMRIAAKEEAKKATSTPSSPATEHSNVVASDEASAKAAAILAEEKINPMVRMRQIIQKKRAEKEANEAKQLASSGGSTTGNDEASADKDSSTSSTASSSSSSAGDTTPARSGSAADLPASLPEAEHLTKST